MKDIRCTCCHKKLAEGEFIHLTIKCPRCKTLNILSTRSATTERPGTPPRSNGSHHERSHSSPQ